MSRHLSSAARPLGVALVLGIGGAAAPTDAVRAQDTAADSSAFEFETSVGSSRNFEYATDWIPPALAENALIGTRRYFYAGAPGATVVHRGNFIARWDPTAVYPGNQVTITVTPTGLPNGSRYEAAGGVTSGLQYRVIVNKSRFDYASSGYVPRMPYFEVLIDRASDFTAFSDGRDASHGLSTVGDPQGSICTPWGYVPGTDSVYCFWHGGSDFEFQLDCQFICDSPGLPLHIEGTRIEGSVPAALGGLGLGLALDLSACVTHRTRVEAIRDQADQQDRIPGEPFAYVATVPCELAQQDDEERVFGFESGPYQLRDSRILLDVALRLGSAVEACYCFLFECAVAGRSVCFPKFEYAFETAYNTVAASFELPVVTPRVTNIAPSGGCITLTPAVDSLDITWDTTWGTSGVCGAADACSLKVDIYAERVNTADDPPTVIVSTLINEGDRENDGCFRWGGPDLYGPCVPTWIRIELRNRDGLSLADDHGGVFAVAPPGNPCCPGPPPIPALSPAAALILLGVLLLSALRLGRRENA